MTIPFNPISTQQKYTADDALADMARLSEYKEVLAKLAAQGIPHTSSGVSHIVNQSVLSLLGAIEISEKEIKRKMENAKTET